MSGNSVQQVAALPWRFAGSGLEILLVTTRETNRWVIPKGWASKSVPDWHSAEIEAFEEAGVSGKIATSSIGCFSYEKRQKDGSLQPLTVSVFALEVDSELEMWPEMDERVRRWFSPSEAAASVGEPELQDIIASFNASRA